MNGVKKNKNQQQNGMNNKFGKGNGMQQPDSMKKEYGNSEKSTKPGNGTMKSGNGMMKKSSPSNGMTKKSTPNQNKMGSNKYFSSKTSYKKGTCSECGDIEPKGTKRGR